MTAPTCKVTFTIWQTNTASDHHYETKNTNSSNCTTTPHLPTIHSYPGLAVCCMTTIIGISIRPWMCLAIKVRFERCANMSIHSIIHLNSRNLVECLYELQTSLALDRVLECSELTKIVTTHCEHDKSMFACDYKTHFASGQKNKRGLPTMDNAYWLTTLVLWYGMVTTHHLSIISKEAIHHHPTDHHPLSSM